LLKDLDEELVRDVDILTEPQNASSIREYLEDNDFEETKKPHEPRGYQRVEGSLFFVNKEFDKPIHLVLMRNSDGGGVWTEKTIIGEKFNRGFKTDLLQLQNIITNRLKRES